MPNHLTSVCTVTGDEREVSRFREHCIVSGEKGETMRFAFEQIVPVPPEVEGTESGSEADLGLFALSGLESGGGTREEMRQAFGFPGQLELYARHHPTFAYVRGKTSVEDLRKHLEKHAPQVLEKGRKALACFRATGAASWYEWNQEHWGTKWNAYEYAERSREPGKFVFEFQTAWSIPKPVFLALSKQYPQLRFEGTTIDEGGGAFVWNFFGDCCRIIEVEETREREVFVYGRAREEDDEV